MKVLKFVGKNIFLILSSIAAAGGVVFSFINMETAKPLIGVAMIMMSIHIFFYIMVGTTAVDKKNE